MRAGPRLRPLSGRAADLVANTGHLDAAVDDLDRQRIEAALRGAAEVIAGGRERAVVTRTAELARVAIERDRAAEVRAHRRQRVDALRVLAQPRGAERDVGG